MGIPNTDSILIEDFIVNNNLYLQIDKDFRNQKIG